MLVIRDAQLAELGMQRRRAYLETLAEQLAGDFPLVADQMGEPGLYGVAEAALETGERLGLGSKGSVAALAALMVQYGRKLERYPGGEWAWRTLENTGLPEVIRMDMVVERMASAAKGRVIVEQDGD